VPGIEGVADVERGLGAMLSAIPFRQACHWRAFASAMEVVCGSAPSCTFYVSSDDLAAIHALRAHFERTEHAVLALGDDVLHGCSDASGDGPLRRGTRCQQVALADQLTLANESRFLLTSTWSSFSELVLLWSPRLLKRSRSGCAPVQRRPQ
jgi:hypothetical protein